MSDNTGKRGKGKGRGRGKVLESKSPESGGATSDASPVQSPAKANFKGNFVTRPSSGTRGKSISIVVNHFPVSVSSNAVYHYDVEMEFVPNSTNALGAKLIPKPVPVSIKRKVMEALFKQMQELGSACPVYDGNKNVFTCRPVPGIGGFTNKTVILPKGNRENAYKVKLQPVGKAGQTDCSINLSRLRDLYQRRTNEISQEAILALDIVLRHGSHQKLPSQGRSFYCKPNSKDRNRLSDGKMIWSGFYQSVRPDLAGTALVVSKTSQIFYPDCNVLAYLEMILGKPVQGMKKLHPSTISQMSRELRDARFVATHLEHRPSFKCDGLTKETAREISFTKEENGRSVTLTVEDYFRETYAPLKFPMFPCLKVAGKFFPMETAHIEDNQPYKKALNDKHRSEMIKITTSPPERFLQDVKYFAEQIRKNSAKERTAYGLSFAAEPVTVTARVIDPPSVTYKKGSSTENVTPRDGAWGLRFLGFYDPGKIQTWVIWCVDQHVEIKEVEHFGERFCNTAKRMGLWMNAPLKVVKLPSRGLDKIASNLAFFQSKALECTKGNRLDLLMIVLPAKDDHAYAEIKYCAETKLGLMTQCVLSKNVSGGGNDMLICNILQKVNSKVGGRNCSLFRKDQPLTMFVGADVNHAGPRDKEKKSFAAVVASVDAEFNRYISNVREQTNPAETKHHLEMIGDVRKTMKEFLIEFKKNTGRYPERILFYRDGVSEGEFAELQRKEIAEIRAACRELQAAVKMTVVVVAKRHHTRFFPADPKDGVGKARNVPPGTVVDTVIVHPVYYDFYLCSHFGIQGTNRPTHYTVLEDDSKFTPDEIQTMTYYMCHMSARCTRAESIPTPVKYAHLSALRHRQYSIHVRHNGTQGSEDEDEDDQQESVSNMMEQVVPIDIMKKKMFFV